MHAHALTQFNHVARCMPWAHGRGGELLHGPAALLTRSPRSTAVSASGGARELVACATSVVAHGARYRNRHPDLSMTDSHRACSPMLPAAESALPSRLCFRQLLSLLRWRSRTRQLGRACCCRSAQQQQCAAPRPTASSPSTRSVALAAKVADVC